MNLLSRRWVCGCLLTVMLAGCSQPQSSDPPLPMGPPVETPKASAQVDFGNVPESFQVKFETTQGDFVIEVQRDWSPQGAVRFYELVRAGFYDDCRFFRVIPTFMVQFGINGDPKVMDKWRDANIPDDRPTGANRKSNQPGFVTFAKAQFPNSRSTQVFINYVDNGFLDSQGFTPFGQVVSGMDVVKRLNSQYEGAPSDHQQEIQHQGNAYLDKAFPGLDSIKSARIVGVTPEGQPDDAQPADADKAATKPDEPVSAR